jgi:hypothetical protein
MGTDAQDTIDQIEWKVKYFIQCCSPENKDAILEQLAELSKLISKGGNNDHEDDLN